MGQILALCVSKKLTRTSDFDILLTKSVPHILETIFLSLDYKSFKTCMEVTKAWNELLKSKSFQRKAKSVFEDEVAN